jgi:hypothetical protein
MPLTALGESAATEGGGTGFVTEVVRVLTRPGPPPRGWARLTAVIVAGVAVASLVIAWAGWVTRGNPHRYFGEQRPGTLLSAGLLFACAGTCRRIHALPAAAGFGRFWAVHVVFFAYLGLDELLRIHERLDRYAHRLFGLNANHPVTDHLDDLIIMAYAVFAAALWYRCRRPLLRLPWTVLTMGTAFAAFAAMMAVDLAAEIKAVEDSLKLLAGALVLSALLAARQEVKRFA